jgi:hypothetical protein
MLLKQGNAGNSPVVIEEQGSFAIGSKVLVNEDGHTFHGDHGYVFYQYL